MENKKMNAKEIIKKHGGQIVGSYMLVNNWGYDVKYNGTEYDVRRWANCYGSDCGWGVMWLSNKGGDRDEQWMRALDKDLNNYEINGEW